MFCPQTYVSFVCHCTDEVWALKLFLPWKRSKCFWKTCKKVRKEKELSDSVWLELKKGASRRVPWNGEKKKTQHFVLRLLFKSFFKFFTLKKLKLGTVKVKTCMWFTQEHQYSHREVPSPTTKGWQMNVQFCFMLQWNLCDRHVYTDTRMYHFWVPF